MFRNVLIVDDDPSAYFYVKKNLEDNKVCNVRLISNIETALNLKELLQFDLIICDLNMPFREGLTFISQVKKMGYSKSIFLYTFTHSKLLQELAIPNEYILNKLEYSDEKLVSFISGKFL